VVCAGRNESSRQIPYGTKDFLPQEAAGKRQLENILAELFRRWGYDEVITPTFEYLETLTAGSDPAATQTMFKFFDQNNSLVALRPDMTAPIARVAATRLKEVASPLRLFYLANVFRQEQTQTGRLCEFYQAGVELYGFAGAAADAEVVALAVEALSSAGLEKFQIGLGQVGFVNGLLQDAALPASFCRQIRHCLVTRNLVGLDETLAASGLDQARCEIIRAVPLLQGRQEVLNRAAKMVGDPASLAALENLAEIYRLLKSYGVEERIVFDLGLIRDFGYYTGLVFEGYAPGLGFPICGGGRYDGMLAAFGIDCPATGFALGMERIMLAMAKQGREFQAAPKELYVAWQEGWRDKATAEAAKRRRAGLTAELGHKPETRAEAEMSRQARGCRKLIYFGE